MHPEDQPALSPGTRLGVYEIVRKLGAGGMGAVYLATDTTLNRPAALKILRPGKALSETARRRLTGEAQLASALNHPNIVTVYQIGSEGSTDFIAMEYIAGKTLKERIPRNGMPVREALGYAIQVAAALGAAHEAGLVHRDLKPGNIMVTDRGLVKVVDFGLAKRAATSSDPESGDDDSTASMSLTAPGLTVGTYAFMSPEQVEGHDVDSRSDVWAFGCVLYQMATGRPAFQGASAMSIMAAVMNLQPPNPREIAPSMPPVFERIITRCLQKRVVDRWQSIVDVRLLLEDLDRELQSPDAAAVGPRRPLLPALAATGLLAAALGAGAVGWSLGRPATDTPQPVLRMATLDSGLSGYPSLSRDGTLLAFASDRGGQDNLDIWIQQVGGRQPIRLTQDPADDTSPSLSPDGTKVVFRSERNGGGIYVVPALGGEATLLAAGGRNPRFSPDGRWIAYWSGREGGYLAGSARVFVVEAGGGPARQLAPQMACALYPVWSPSGDQLLTLARDDANTPQRVSLDWWVIPVDKGTPRKTGVLAGLRSRGLLPDSFIPPPPGEWLPESGAVRFALPTGDAFNLWEVRLKSSGQPAAPATRLTLGPGHQAGVSSATAKNSHRMAFGETPLNYDVWTVPADVELGVVRGDAARWTSAPSAEVSPSLPDDGSRLVYISRQAGAWTMRLRELASGIERTLLTSERFISNAEISGDGRQIIFSTENNILTMPAAGGSAEELCHRCGTVMGVSRDGRRTLYEPLENEDLVAWDSASRSTMKLGLRDSPTSVISGARYSPDGNWVVFHEIDNRSATSRVWIVRSGGTLPVPRSEWIAVTDGTAVERDPAWSPAGAAVYFLSERDGFRCIWARRLDASRRPAGAAFPVRHFHSARWSLSRLGSQGHLAGLSAVPGRLVFSLGELTGNIWLEETPLAAR